MTVDPKPHHPVHLEDYTPFVGSGEVGEIRALAAHLRDRRVQMVNSTAIGGGVAEMLNFLVPMFTDLGISIRWEVMTGGNDFFEVTKGFHNALHGGPYHAREEDFRIYLECNEGNLRRSALDADFIVIHDPQPAALVTGRANHTGRWIWRCHIDLSHPNTDVWNFLEPYIARYDGAIFSSPEFTRQLPVPQYLIHPCIDPLAEKNRELEPEEVRAVAERFSLDTRRPILTQISRFDRLKDPLGVLKAYRIVRRYFDCQLVLAGGSAGDDPEGGQVLAEIRSEAEGDQDIHILDLPPWSAHEINALQRASTIIIQKSLREGFGLTVTEGLWKKKPVIASAVGGIPSQIIHKQTGLLVHSIEGAAYQIRFLLSNPAIAAQLGAQGHDHVRENFLVTTNVRRYLTLFLHLADGR